jgi:hypothetical protein
MIFSCKYGSRRQFRMNVCLSISWSSGSSTRISNLHKIDYAGQIMITYWSSDMKAWNESIQRVRCVDFQLLLILGGFLSFMRDGQHFGYAVQLRIECEGLFQLGYFSLLADAYGNAMLFCWLFRLTSSGEIDITRQPTEPEVLSEMLMKSIQKTRWPREQRMRNSKEGNLSHLSNNLKQNDNSIISTHLPW